MAPDDNHFLRVGSSRDAENEGWLQPAVPEQFHSGAFDLRSAFVLSLEPIHEINRLLICVVPCGRV